MAEHRLAMLDTCVVIDMPGDLAQIAESVAISAVTVGELAFGLHHPDPLTAATRERLYRDLLSAFTPVPYDQHAAHLFGAIAVRVAETGRNPRSRTSDLMIAATALSMGAVVLTRNPGDFKGLEGIVSVVGVG